MLSGMGSVSDAANTTRPQPTSEATVNKFTVLTRRLCKVGSTRSKTRCCRYQSGKVKNHLWFYLLDNVAHRGDVRHVTLPPVISVNLVVSAPGGHMNFCTRLA